MKDLDTKTETITPEKAAEYLALMEGNRKKKPKAIRLYAADMAAGRWELNGEAIKFNGRRLVDGQNRLHACIRSGSAFRTLVVRGVDERATRTMDNGVKRGVADAMHMFSDSALPNANTVAACARLVMALRVRPDNPVAAYSDFTQAQSVMEIEGNLEAYVDAGQYGKRFTGWAPASASAALMLLARDADYSQWQLDDYREKIVHGIGLSESHPCLTYRNWKAKHPVRGKVDAWTYLSAHVKCFGAFAHGRSLQKLYTWSTGSPFPVLERVAK